jgi:hypothetical protein
MTEAGPTGPVPTEPEVSAPIAEQPQVSSAASASTLPATEPELLAASVEPVRENPAGQVAAAAVDETVPVTVDAEPAARRGPEAGAVAASAAGPMAVLDAGADSVKPSDDAALSNPPGAAPASDLLMTQTERTTAYGFALPADEPGEEAGPRSAASPHAATETVAESSPRAEVGGPATVSVPGAEGLHEARGEAARSLQARSDAVTPASGSDAGTPSDTEARPAAKQGDAPADARDTEEATRAVGSTDVRAAEEPASAAGSTDAHAAGEAARAPESTNSSTAHASAHAARADAGGDAPLSITPPPSDVVAPDDAATARAGAQPVRDSASTVHDVRSAGAAVTGAEPAHDAASPTRLTEPEAGLTAHTSQEAEPARDAMAHRSPDVSPEHVAPASPDARHDSHSAPALAVPAATAQAHTQAETRAASAASTSTASELEPPAPRAPIQLVAVSTPEASEPEPPAPRAPIELVALSTPEASEPEPPAPRAPIEFDDLPASSGETMELASTWEFVGWQGREGNGTIGHVSETSWADRAVDLDGPAVAAAPAEAPASEVPLASAWDFIQQPWQPPASTSERVSSLLAAASASTETPSGGPAVTAEQVLAALEAVGTQGTLGRVLLAYCAGRFRRAFLLGESLGLARVGHAWGPGSDSPAVSALKVDLEAPSLLTAAMASTGPSVFSAPSCAQDEAIFSALGEASSRLLVVTLRSKGRPIAFVVADPGSEPVDPALLEDLGRVVDKASEAYERLPTYRSA